MKAKNNEKRYRSITFGSPYFSASEGSKLLKEGSLALVHGIN